MESILSYELTADRICYESGGCMWTVMVGLRFDEHHVFVQGDTYFSLCLTVNEAAVSRSELGHVPEEAIVAEIDIGDFNTMTAQEILDAAIAFLGW